MGTTTDTGRARAFMTALLVGAALATPAIAQEAAPADRGATDLPGEIVVTAQRREETANSIGMAIQAFSGEQLEQLRVTDVRDLSSVAPSFSVSQSYQGVPIYTLRGIGFNTINLSATSTVGSYVDEVAYPFPFMLTGPIFDLNRVEVLKGPQGTLYGRNTTAGLIDFITNTPTEEFEASLSVDIGNYDTHNYGGFISGPLAENLRARFAFRIENSDEGWQESNTRNDQLGDVHRAGARIRAEWEPTDRLSFDLSLSGWINQSDPLAGQGIGFTPATDPTTTPPGRTSPFNAPGLAAYIANNRPTDATQADWAPANVRSANVGIGEGLAGPLQEDNTFYAAAVRATYEISPDLRIVSLTGYNRLERDALFDWSGAPYEVLLQRADGEIRSFSEELRIEGGNDTVQWLIGAYYGDDQIRDNNRTMLGQNANVAFIRTAGAAILAGVNPLTLGALPPGYNPGPYTQLQMSQAFRTYRDIAEMEASTRSIFANAEWSLSDTLSLTTGVRWTEDEHSYRGCSADHNGSMLPNVNAVNRLLYQFIYGVAAPTPIALNGCNTFNPITGQFGQVAHSLTENNVAWRVALDWNATDDVLFYASVSEGAKAGVTPVNAASTSTQQAPARQETLLAYEVGVKAGLFDRAVQLNASAFYYDYTDKQLSVFFADPDLHRARAPRERAR